MANAGLFGGLGPVGYVNSLYQPQQAALASQQAARVNTLNALVGSILAHLSTPQPDVYGAAAQDATSAANGAAQTLARVNPNASTQAMLQAINAPGSQQQQVGQQNANTFGGGGALDQYLGGAVPAGVFAQDQAARQAYLSSLPAIVGQSAIMGLGRLNMLASQENSKLASDKAAALQKARTDLADFVMSKQKLGMQAQKQAFDQAATSERLKQGQQRLDLTAQMDAFNQKYKVAGLKLQGQRLNLAAQKFAQQTINQDRNYALSLKRFGLEQRRMQIQAVKDEYKLKNGGFTPLEINKFKTSAFNIANNAFNGGGENGPFYTSGPNKGKPLARVDFQTAVKEMRGAGVPLSIAMPALAAAGYAEAKKNADFAGSLTALGGAADSAFSGVTQFAGKTAKNLGYIVSAAKQRGLDPVAVLAVASQEGLGGGVGDNGTSFGPWQLHAGGALPAVVWAKGPTYAHQWAWSPAGINYALDRIAGVARGLSGAQAVNAIVREFERPAKPNNEVAGALGALGGY